MKNTKKLMLLFLLASLLISGCASMEPMSNVARKGDTVTISLGGTEGNVLSPMLEKEDVAVTITDAAGATHPVKLRHLFRVYSDPTSSYDFSSEHAYTYYPGAAKFGAYVTPHQGIWMAILDLVDPATDNPLPLAEGTANLHIDSLKVQNSFDPIGQNLWWTNGDLSNIPLEIVPGEGSPNGLNFMQNAGGGPVGSLEPNPQLDITVSGTPSGLIGGGYFVFRYLDSDFDIVTEPKITTTTPDPNVQLAAHRTYENDGSVLLNVMISNPNGFKKNNRKIKLRLGRSMLRSLRFNVVWDRDWDSTNWEDTFELVSAEYFDLNGNVMPELSPAVVRLQ